MSIVAKDDRVRLDRLELGPFSTNTYVLTCRKTGDSIVVDAPGQVGRILTLLKDTRPRYILMTHSHMDHTGGLSQLKSALNVEVAAHPEDAKHLPVKPDVLLNDGDEPPFGADQVQVIHTPGHTPGSLCFLFGGYLIAGDTLFPGGPGKTSSPGHFRQIIESITRKIFRLSDDIRVFPGHGEATTLGKEKKAFQVFSSRPHDPNLCGDVLWESS
jgi:glyoxylase-like metal-dependent hydrolase (beta-lactamase superfamily II)